MARPLTRSRPPQGAHLAELRLAAGLSQAELGNLIGENQQAVAYWELSERPPRGDVLPKLAKALGVTIEQILNIESVRPARKPGPPGKLVKLVEEASKLTRRQQERIADLLAVAVEQEKRRTS